MTMLLFTTYIRTTVVAIPTERTFWCAVCHWWRILSLINNDWLDWIVRSAYANPQFQRSLISRRTARQLRNDGKNWFLLLFPWRPSVVEGTPTTTSMVSMLPFCFCRLQCAVATTATGLSTHWCCPSMTYAVFLCGDNLWPSPCCHGFQQRIISADIGECWLLCLVAY